MYISQSTHTQHHGAAPYAQYNEYIENLHLSKNRLSRHQKDGIYVDIYIAGMNVKEMR